MKVIRFYLMNQRVNFKLAERLNVTEYECIIKDCIMQRNL
jgi:hypothetical protein